MANSTADRAIEILLAFSEDHPVWTASALSRHFDMPRSTVYRYINSLRAYGLVTGDEKGGFQLSSKIVALARVASSSATIAAIARPVLEELADQFGEMVNLTERIGIDLVPLERIECRHHVRILFMRASLLPWPANASGKLLLAFASAKEREEILRQLSPHAFTARTITDRAALEAECERIPERGLSLNDCERDEGVFGIAAPIPIGSQVRHCVTIGGPAYRFTPEKIEEMSAAVRGAAERIAAEMQAYRLETARGA